MARPSGRGLKSLLGPADPTGGSRWTRSGGRAVDGTHEGSTLARANGVSLVWFSWLDFHLDTALYGDVG